MSDPAPLDAAALRACLGTFVTGVTVITTADSDGVQYGMTANSFNSVSLDPPLILWSLRLNARLFPVFSRAERFAVNILAEDQVNISAQFAKPDADRFSGIICEAGLGGSPLIKDCAAHLECRQEASYPGGDHVVFIGRIERFRTAPRRALAFGAGRYLVVHPHDMGLLPTGENGSAVASSRAVHLARPLLEELGRELELSVGLAVWGNQGPTIVWWSEARRPLDMRLRFGLVMTVSRSAAGLVFAAFLPPDVTASFINAEFAQNDGPAICEPVSRAAFEQALETVRETKLGFVAENIMAGVNERGIHATSTPVFDRTGSIVMALGVISDQKPFQREDTAVRRLVETAESLSGRLGYVPP